MSGSTISFSRGEDPLRADKLNKAFSERVIRSGDTMLGSFTLAHDPVVPLEAATKQYVDNYLYNAAGTFLPLTGGTLTGPLILHADPTTDPQAATKHYVDNMAVAGVTSFNTRIGVVTLTNADVVTVLPSAATLPLVNGTAAAGSGTTWSRADHVHPTDTSRAAASAIPVASSTLPLALGTAAIGASVTYARADHVHPGTSGGASVSIADTPPATPSVGDMWFDSVGTQLYLRYNDGTSTQWVPASNQMPGLAEAPTDGYQYARRSSAWARVATPDVGRNLIHNAGFTVRQRGVGPWTANGNYTLDRWQLSLSLDTASISQAAHSDASRAQVGDESAAFLLGNTFTGNAGAAAFNRIMQKIEDVRRLAGKTVTVSFWAASGAGTPKLGVGFVQNFGTGGSPSAAVAVAGQSVTISTTYTRYSVTFAFPSVSGKTLGTANDHNTELSFWFSSGTTQAATAGNPGVQSGTIALWGVQLEVGSVATPLDYGGSPEQILRQCQRFYQTGNAQLNGYNTAGGTLAVMGTFPTTMRAQPTLTPTGTGGANFTAFSFTPVASNGWLLSFNASATGAAAWAGTYTASADL